MSVVFSIHFGQSRHDGMRGLLYIAHMEVYALSSSQKKRSPRVI